MWGIGAMKARSDCQWFKDSISSFIILLSFLLVLLGMNDIRSILGDTPESLRCPLELCECSAALWSSACALRVSRPCSSTEQEPEWWKKLQFLVRNLTFPFGKSAWLVQVGFHACVWFVGHRRCRCLTLNPTDRSWALSCWFFSCVCTTESRARLLEYLHF